MWFKELCASDFHRVRLNIPRLPLSILYSTLCVKPILLIMARVYTRYLVEDANYLPCTLHGWHFNTTKYCQVTSYTKNSIQIFLQFCNDAFIGFRSVCLQNSMHELYLNYYECSREVFKTTSEFKTNYSFKIFIN